MLALVLSAQALLVPLVSQQPVVVVQSIVQHRSLLATQQGNVFPASTTLLAVGRANLPNGEYYKGESKDLDLGSFLDSVPVDLGGKSGVEKDMAGVARVKGKTVETATMSPAEKQKAKQAEFAAKQAANAENGFSLPSVKLPF